jgi:hypothetical protein
MEESERQKYLQLITKKLVILTAGCLVLLFIFFYIIKLNGGERTYLVLNVFTAGLIGGFLSIQQRMPSIGLNELQELSRSWSSILLIPINGGIFAIVLMLMFLSGILEGAMFPKYVHAPIDHQNLSPSFTSWLIKTFPASGIDIAKLLFWSFVAGFSERFVPQIIRKSAANADESAGSGEPSKRTGLKY